MRLIDAVGLRKKVHDTLFKDENGEVIHGELEKAIRKQMEQIIKNAPRRENEMVATKDKKDSIPRSEVSSALAKLCAYLDANHRYDEGKGAGMAKHIIDGFPLSIKEYDKELA